MQENITEETIQQTPDKMTEFKKVCLKLGIMLIIVFVSRGACTILLSLMTSSGFFDGMSVNNSYLIQSLFSFLFLYIIPIIGVILLFKPKGMCGRVYKKPEFFSNAMLAFPAMYGLAIMTNLLTMLVSMIFTETDLYRSFNTVNDLKPDTMFCAMVLLFQLVVIAPIFEEFWYRGVVMEALRPFGNGFAIILSGLLFGLTHANLSQFFYATVLGICLGYIAVSTKSILTTTLMHAMFNGISGILLVMVTLPDVGDYLMSTNTGIKVEDTPNIIMYKIYNFVIIMLMIVGVFMAVFKLKKLKKFKVPKMWEMSAATRWGVFMSRFTVIIALVFAADTMTFRFITEGIYKLLSSMIGTTA